MSNRILKPSYLPKQLVDRMEKEKGITFNTYSKDAAVDYLTNKNNYLRTASYRKNYKKHSKGKNRDKYINLDFGYLVELSTIDTETRYIINEMCLDIEHFLKLSILNEVDNNPNVDAYDIVKSFLSSNQKIIKNISFLANSPFVSDLVHKYFTVAQTATPRGIIINEITDYSDCPIWVLLELLTFGDFIKFYDYYYNNYPSKNMVQISILNVVKSLRNGTSHNNCILSNLNKTSSTRAPAKVSIFVAKIKDITDYNRRKKLSSRTTMEITTLLYLYTIIIPKNIKDKRKSELNTLISCRMLKNQRYFVKNNLISSTYRYFVKIIDYCFGL